MSNLIPYISNNFNGIFTIIIFFIIFCFILKLIQSAMKLVLIGILVVIFIAIFPGIKNFDTSKINDTLINTNYEYEENGEIKTIPIQSIKSAELITTDEGRAFKLMIKNNDGSEKSVISPIKNTVNTKELKKN